MFLSFNYWIIKSFCRGSEFSSYEIELQNQATQNDVTSLVNNSKQFVEILVLSH